MNIAEDTKVQTTTIHTIGRKTDTIWMLVLYGTAVGAGVLFLPINAGTSGLLPLLIIVVISFPMTFLAHRGLTRFVLSGNYKCNNITDVIKEHFGSQMGNLITLLYFFSIYPILLAYGVAVTNTIEVFIVYITGGNILPRALLAMLTIFSLIVITWLDKDIIVKIINILVLPFIGMLIFLSFYLINYWSNTIFDVLWVYPQADIGQLLSTLWLTIPVMVFSFNHSPIISSFAMSKRAEYGDQAEPKCSRVLVYSNLMMFFTVMFFVFSCVLSLTHENMQEAKQQNISVLSYLANHLDDQLIAYLGPIITFIAVTKSFLGHYLGASEGFSGIVCSVLQHILGKDIPTRRITKWTAIFMFLTNWSIATINPSILSIIETFGGPIIAILLFLMPMYAITRVPAMARYRGLTSNYFVWITGLLTLTATIYKFL